MSDPRGEETHWEPMTYHGRLYCVVLVTANDRGRMQVKGTVQSACVRVCLSKGVEGSGQNQNKLYKAGAELQTDEVIAPV